ncbi:M17 family metallopeptidase [Mycoplasmopsis meleagridis]|uniref:M17 family metallopeptidase n=1 Tax=Mycoplasmopsis meleagridis TaxID=29561 RepID=UPI00073D3C47|nr:M17 family metallopeptidase [Mycoplasmopsis meleagridis]KUH47493.1 peptidase M17 [Mycoplasmopsis meleagridis]
MQFNSKRSEQILLKASYEKTSFLTNFKNGQICEFLDKKEAYIYIDKKLDKFELKDFVDEYILKLKREYQIDLKSFVNDNLKYNDLLNVFVSQLFFYKAKLFNKKKEEEKIIDFSLLFDEKDEEEFNKLKIIYQARNSARNLQIMPENYCNSEQLANYIINDFSGIENLKVKVLDKKEIEELKMGLILSVNKGSTHEARVVIIEYNGNKDNENEKIVFVGKGITFDTGGVNTKGYHMKGMKYDMSGSVIVAYALKAIAELKVRKNVAAIMMITDNRLAQDASLPENIYLSMAGKSVEVADTDAEGRLVLADGLFYGAEKLKASLLVDVVTLTGTILTVLGNSHSGIYADKDYYFNQFNLSANKMVEKIWRMPLHDDFNETNKSSLVADLMNYSEDELSDCNTAAMFLKEFTNNVPFIHCDVAGTADKDNKPQGILIPTLVDFVLNFTSEPIKKDEKSNG